MENIQTKVFGVRPIQATDFLSKVRPWNGKRVLKECKGPQNKTTSQTLPPNVESGKPVWEKSVTTFARKASAAHHVGQQGQIVVEYVLLMMIAVVVALVITTTMVSRSAESPGFLILRWSQLLEVIGSDFADDQVRTE